MKILITGGAGYIGTPLVDLLCANPLVEKIIVYDNLSRANYNLFIGSKNEGHQKINFFKGELLDSRRLRQALKGVDVVYHLAARVTTPFANSCNKIGKTIPCAIIFGAPPGWLDNLTLTLPA